MQKSTKSAKNYKICQKVPKTKNKNVNKHRDCKLTYNFKMHRKRSTQEDKKVPYTKKYQKITKMSKMFLN